MIRICLIALSIFLSTSLSYCQAWNETYFKVEIPAEFNVSSYKRILIAEILENNKVSNLASNIYDELANAILRIGNIEIVDREKVNLLLKEFEFQESGYVDESFFKEKGNFISTGLIMVGRIQACDYHEKIEKKNKLVVVNGCGHTNKRIGKYVISFNFKLIDLERSEVVFSKTVNSSYKVATPSCDCCSPQSLNKDEIYISCVKAFGNDIEKILGGYTKDVKVTYQKNKLFNESLKQIIVYFNVNEHTKALMELAKIANSQSDPSAKSSAFYNLAISQYFFLKLEEAKENAKQAYVSNPKNTEALELFNKIDTLLNE